MTTSVAPKMFVAVTGYADVSVGTAGVSTISTTFSGWIEQFDYNPLGDVSRSRPRSSAANPRLIG